ncbi:MAG: diacylglycerol kinase family protein [Candidatus Levyibacteriota bacterium]|nr:MAG: diacylglycerol kinase family protein [Candidatus Levybacteria bacterium]
MVDFKRLLLSFKYAFEGITYAFVHDQNLRIHILVTLFVLTAGIFYKLSGFEMWILGIMILFVVMAEMLNTAIEQMVNLISLEHKKEAKIAKDVSAGMVFFTVIAAIIVGLLIFLPHIFINPS